MSKSFLWTSSRARLKFIRSQKDSTINWLFLPGGPGLGSESLDELTDSLSLPGTLWHLDLPGDGSNRAQNNCKAFERWPDALLEAVRALDRVILVAHSSGGMYALSLPELEKELAGLVLLDSAPNASWQASFEKMRKRTPIDGLKNLEELYEKNPSDALLKEITLLCAPYFFSPSSLQRGVQLLQRPPYNRETFDWSGKHFDATYEAKWVPKQLPTLILAGSEDELTPLALFKEQKEFNRSNIVIREIARAAHFPWIENPEEVAAVFSEYAQNIRV